MNRILIFILSIYLSVYYPQSGVPSTVSVVKLPGSLGSASFTNNSNVYIVSNASGASLGGQRQSVVEDATGFKRTWNFAAAQVFYLDDYDPATNTGTMQLIKTTTHVQNGHDGGVLQYETATGIQYQ